MATQYTPILQLALPVTGELNGTWGDVVNDNITSMVEQAIAGLATINTWTANSHTLTTANGTTDEARCAMLVAADGSGGTALSGAGQIICPSLTKLYVLQNTSATYAVTLKTAAGSGVAVAAGETAFLFCNGTSVNACVTTIVNGHITGNLTVDGNATVNGNTTLGNATSDTITATARIASDLNPSADNTYDLGTAGNSWRNLYIDGTATIATLNVTTIDTTNLEVTNIKAKDGTASITLTDSTGVATLSANPVLNAGTANGVAYLNGSKVLTTGSALTFDGSTLQILNGTASKLNLYSSNSTSAATLTFAQIGSIGWDTGIAATTGHYQIGISGGTTAYNINRNGASIDYHSWYSAGSEQMRLTSTGLGIGTSSPSYKLDVAGAARSDSWIGRSNTSAPATDAFVYRPADNTLGFGTASAEKMRLDSSGNLGLGVTPSAWTLANAFQLGAAGSLAGSTTQLGIYTASNVYYNGGWKYQTNGTATQCKQNENSSGGFAWNIAPSGTAGNAITFTQAMTLDASGNLLVGSTASSYLIGNRTALVVNGTSTALVGLQTGGVNKGYFYSDGTNVLLYSEPVSGFMAFGTANTERMRIDSSGNVGIGTSSPQSRLNVYSSTAGNAIITLSDATLGVNYGAQIKGYGTGGVGGFGEFGVIDAGTYSKAILVAQQANYLSFYTGASSGASSERMRIDSSGNVQLSTAGTKLLNSSGRPILNQSGSILQVVQGTSGANSFSTSSASLQATGLSVTITPATTSSKVYISVTANGRAAQSTANSNCYVDCALYRNGSQIWYGFAQIGNFGSSDVRNVISVNYLDSPATTSAMTYQLYIGSGFATTVYLNQSNGTSTITAMEVSA